jgi:hypothetical protein
VILGCIIKLLTAALARRALFETGWPLSTPIVELGGEFAIAGFEHITIRHLLEHSHGLDAAGIPHVPRRADSRIDVRLLGEWLTSPRRIHAPGELISYSSAGAWLLAAISERLTGRSYAELLARIVEGSGFEDCCPARGGAARVSSSALMSFLEQQMHPSPTGLVDEDGADALISRVVARPGWTVSDEGILLGWNYYGAGWFGHNSIHPEAPAMVRLHPQRRVALIVSSPTASPAIVAARRFGAQFPELFRAKTPRARSIEEREPVLHRYAGRYATQGTHFHVSVIHQQTLQIERTGLAEPARTELRAAGGDVFIATVAHPLVPRFCHFIGWMNGAFRHLWNGEAAFPNLGRGAGGDQEIRCRTSRAKLPSSLAE